MGFAHEDLEYLLLLFEDGNDVFLHCPLRHQAHLEIESKENQGSIFKVIFPKERTYNPE
jgi:two-component system phosphate regulon sensor histidine kinase PhoR